MHEISNLAYLGLGVKDLAAWRTFAEDLLGLRAVDGDGDELRLRMDDQPYRFILEPSETDDLSFAGWLFDTEKDLDVFVEDARRNGAAIELLSPEMATRRRVAKLYACKDPNGYAHEFCYGFDVVPTADAFRSKVLRGGFVTGDLGLGHFLPMSRDGAATVKFYNDVLKLRISDHIRQEVGDGVVVNAHFYHTRTGRHHSIATAEMATPKVLNHIMIQVEDFNDVGLAYDRCVAAGMHIAAELGHHPNDKMFSFYVRTPSGFNIEFGWGGIVIDDATWQVTTHTQMSDWGHKRNPPPAA